MKKRIYVGAGASALIAIVALATMVSGAIARSGATPLPASSCSAIQNGSGQILVRPTCLSRARAGLRQPR